MWPSLKLDCFNIYLSLGEIILNDMVTNLTPRILVREMWTQSHRSCDRGRDKTVGQEMQRAARSKQNYEGTSRQDSVPH